MSEEVLKGRFETTRGNLAKTLKWASAPFDERYDQAWVNLQDDELNTVANAGESVVAYNTLEDPFIQEVELHNSIDDSAGLEAVLNVPTTEQYLDFVGGERVTVEFYGLENERGCTRMTLDGDLTATFYLPSSESDYESKALQVVNRYNDENEWITASEDTLSTSFRTRVDQFEKIVEAKEFESLALSTYPVVVEDGEFRLDATDDNERDSISGALWAEDVEGPDVENYYTRGFAELFGNIGGEVDVMTEQDSLITVVRENDDETICLRYSVLPAV